MVVFYEYMLLIFAVISAPVFLTGDSACSNTFEELVKLDPCPVNGGWTDWGVWQKCSTTCGPGLTRRNRSCSNPTPSMIGRGCQGDENDYQLCINDSPCAINGFWSVWAPWYCYIYGGKRVRERTCYGPMFGGSDCVGNKTQFKIDTSCTS